MKWNAPNNVQMRANLLVLNGFQFAAHFSEPSTFQNVTERNGTEWNGTERHGMERHGMPLIVLVRTSAPNIISFRTSFT